MKRLQPTTSAALSLAHLSLQRESKKDFRLTQRMTSSRVVKTSTDNNSATVLKHHSRQQSNTTRKMWSIEKDHGNSDTSAIVLTEKRMERKISCVDCLGAFDGF